MILTLILNAFYLFVFGLVGILPTGHIPAAIGSSVDYFVGVVNQFSYVVPVPTLFEALGLVVAVDVAILAWHFLNWIIRKIPGMH